LSLMFFISLCSIKIKIGSERGRIGENARILPQQYGSHVRTQGPKKQERLTGRPVSVRRHSLEPSSRLQRFRGYRWVVQQSQLVVVSTMQSQQIVFLQSNPQCQCSQYRLCSLETCPVEALHGRPPFRKDFIRRPDVRLVCVVLTAHLIAFLEVLDCSQLRHSAYIVGTADGFGDLLEAWPRICFPVS
jgi:hypothetical protein